MILAFDTEELRTICEDDDAAESQLGAEIAEVLRTRVADLRAADTYGDLLAGRPRLVGDRNEVLRLDLARGYCMNLAPNHSAERVDDAGSLDWGRVTRIRLLGIETEG